MVTLQNISRRAVTVLLDYHSFQDPKSKVDPFAHKPIKRARVSHAKNGQLSAIIRTVLLPASITLGAGERRSGLPDEVLECRDVKKLLGKKSLRLLSKTTDEPAPQAAATQPSAGGSTGPTVSGATGAADPTVTTGPTTTPETPATKQKAKGEPSGSTPKGEGPK